MEKKCEMCIRDRAERMAELLSEDCEVNRIAPESTAFVKGVSIASIQMSKGLEFDAVIVPDVDQDTYRTDKDRGLLYIACTRAMPVSYTHLMLRIIPPIPSINRNKEILAISIAINAITILLSI